ncbi:carbohydrate binding family 9 domain-containing protein, partial [bacterium]
MFKRSVILLLLSLLVAPHVKTKEKDHDLPQIKAIRTEEKIEIDGRLTESIWKREGYTKLIQRDPIEGAEPTEKTSVWIAYNEEGLYVAGMCYHSGQDSVIGGLARRDRIVESDWFWFWIDPNNDRQNGFGFAVNPDGSIIDQKLYQDIYENNDWDGLWEAAAQRLKDYWSFEMFIP